MIIQLAERLRLHKLDPLNWSIEGLVEREDPSAAPRWKNFGYYSRLDLALEVAIARHFDQMTTEQALDAKAVLTAMSNLFVDLSDIIASANPAQ